MADRKTVEGEHTSQTRDAFDAKISRAQLLGCRGLEEMK
jgi:hypothetical protein